LGDTQKYPENAEKIEARDHFPGFFVFQADLKVGLYEP
jgi:hypothetical protein